MNKLVRIVSTTGASLAMALGMAGAASADAVGGNLCGSAVLASTTCDTNVTQTTNIDRSRTVNGNCSGIIESNVDQNQFNKTEQEQEKGVGNVNNDGGALLGSNDQSGTSNVNQSSTSSQSQTAGVNFAPNCSTTNVTNVTQQQAARVAQAAQVSAAPSGGVHAGAGGTAKSSASAVAGLSSSLGVLGLGLRLSKRALEL